MIWPKRADLNFGWTKFTRLKKLISVKLLTKYVKKLCFMFDTWKVRRLDSKPFQSRCKGEIPSEARRKEWLRCVKLNQAFLTDSWRRTFQVLYSMYEVRLMKSLASWVVSMTSCSPTSYVSSDPNTKSEEFLWVGAGSTLVLRLYFSL